MKATGNISVLIVVGLMTVIMVSSCGASRNLAGAAGGNETVSHTEAAEALASKRFRIDVSTYYNTDKSRMKESVEESYLQMTDGNAKVSMAEDLYKGDRLSADIYNFEGNADIKKIKETRKGNILYEMNIRYQKVSMLFGTYRLKITLFNNTSECYVEVFRLFGNGSNNVFSFRGIVQPL